MTNKSTPKLDRNCQGTGSISSKVAEIHCRDLPIKEVQQKGSQKFGCFFWLEIVGFCWLNLIEKNPTLFLIADFVAKLYLQLVLDVFLPKVRSK